VSPSSVARICRAVQPTPIPSEIVRALVDKLRSRTDRAEAFRSEGNLRPQWVTHWELQLLIA
jgi:hypothetical protein